MIVKGVEIGQAHLDRVLALAAKGCAWDASRRAMCAVTRRLCDDLVGAGLLEKKKLGPWTPSGAYVATDAGKAFCRKHKDGLV